MSRTHLRVEALERRDTPAAHHSFAAGQLHITFDNAAQGIAGPTGEQSTFVSSYEGVVTLTDSRGYERKINDVAGNPILAGQVREIVVDGTDQPNFIDLHFVDVGHGFQTALNGRVTIHGYGGDDVLDGSQFGDRIRGGTGFDQIRAAGGDDWLAGDTGDDWLYGGDGDNVYQGGSGRDWFDRFHFGDRVVDFGPGDLYDPIGLSPQDIGLDYALRDRLTHDGWNLRDEASPLTVERGGPRELKQFQSIGLVF